MMHYGTRTPLLSEIDRLLDRLGPTGSLDRLDPFGDRDAPGPLRAHRFGHGEDGHDGDSAEADVLAEFERQAERLHDRVVHEEGVFVAEFLGATGSGKTRLVERLIERAPDGERIGVLVGDVAGDDDAARFRDLGVTVANVNTGKECHLDPSMVEGALDEFDLGELDTLYVENVGNMVCPADFPLGASVRALVVSTTEGDDVVRKHPLLFQAVDCAVVNKVDVAEAVNADVDGMVADVAEVAPEIPVYRTSAEHGDGLDDLAGALAEARVGDGPLSHGDHSHDHDGDHGHAHDVTVESGVEPSGE